MNAITKLFKDAEAMRTEESRNMTLKELCDKMAYDAGWHTVYVPNNRSKVKDRVKYSKPLNEHLFCELLVRFQAKIIQQFLDRDGLKMEQAPSKIYDCALRFMNSYNPTMCKNDSQITNRMCTSIRQRAIECHFEEHTRYNFDGINMGQRCRDERARLQQLAEFEANATEEGEPMGFAESVIRNVKPIREHDWRCAINVSLQSTFRVGKNGDERTLESVLEDTEVAARMDYSIELKELMEKYATNEHQKLLLEILVSEGRKMSPSKLLKEFISDTQLPEKEARPIVYDFFKNLKFSLQPLVD